MANIKLNVSCAPIELEQVRARIVINDKLIIDTPDVKSFNITRNRSSNIGSFTATVEVLATANFGTPTGTAGRVQIYAGTKDKYLKKPIFTGRILNVRPQPVPGKPNYFSVSLQGNDVMDKLQNKRFSRRIATDGPGLFVTINGVVGQRPSSMVWSIDKKIRSGKNTFTKPSPDLTGRKEHTSLIKHRDYGKSDQAWITKDGITPVAEPTGGQGGGLGLHQHSSMNTGGPAFGVYSVS